MRFDFYLIHWPIIERFSTMAWGTAVADYKYSAINPLLYMIASLLPPPTDLLVLLAMLEQQIGRLDAAVQQAAEERLHNGLATLPDVLEARSATAQAQYDLQAVLGAEEIARGDLATALGASATTMIRIQPLSEVPTPESVDDSVKVAIDRALDQRPDLLAQAINTFAQRPDLMKTMGVSARKRIQGEFSLDRFLGQFIQVIEGLKA